jgi:hypothetical protein
MPDRPSDPREPTAEMLESLYGELRKLARDRLRRERPGATLRTTELVHEAYLRLEGSEHHGWANRAHFFASAAEAMRRILIERARARGREKRGGEEVARRRGFPSRSGAADSAWTTTSTRSRSTAIRHRGSMARGQRGATALLRGLSVDETAEARRGVRTVRRDWTFARAWLFEALGDASPAA